MTTELYGIVNGHIVDSHLFRGGDVSAEGVLSLVGLHVKSIICLKSPKDDSADDINAEEQIAVKMGLSFYRRPLSDSGIFGYKDISKVPAILELIKSLKEQVIVHCHHGSDRTGVVVACYRIVGGWDVDRAIKEMKEYGNAKYNWGMRNAVRDFAKHLPKDKSQPISST